MSSKIFFDPTIESGGGKLKRDIAEAVVLDVVINEEHPLYDESGFNVGSIRFKYINYGSYVDNSSSYFFANPIDLSFQEYPLIGESVYVQSFRGLHYYSRRMNVNKTLTYNSYYESQNQLLPPPSSIEKSKNIEQARMGGLDETIPSNVEVSKLDNEFFTPIDGLFSLKHFSGDILIQNRFGATMRFGSSQMENALNQKTVSRNGRTVLGPTKKENNNNPIIILRVGQKENPNTTNDTPFALAVEDINLDSSCFTMSSNQEIHFYFSTTNSNVHFRSSNDLGRNFVAPSIDSPLGSLTPLSGNQTILNTGRIILNSKESDIISTSNRSIISLATEDIITDAGRDNILSGKNILLRPEDGYIVLGKLDSGTGTNFTTDPLSDDIDNDTYLSAAIAEPLIEILAEMIDILTPTTAPGLSIAVSGQPIIPNWNSDLKRLSRELSKIRSDIVRIQR